MTLAVFINSDPDEVQKENKHKVKYCTYIYVQFHWIKYGLLYVLILIKYVACLRTVLKALCVESLNCVFII